MVKGQSPQSSYDVLKQRLLVIGTGHFIHDASLGQIDLDSANLLACRIYGLPRLLPYDEGFSDGVTSPTSKLIDAGKIRVVTNLLNYTEGVNKLRILLELGAAYLFKPGKEKTDMDSALYFIQQAQALSGEAGKKWEDETLGLLGKYYYQAGNITESQRCFSRALAHEDQGKHLPVSDPRKLRFLESSLELFRKQHRKEKEIAVRMEIAGTYPALAEKQLQEILRLQKNIGFRHTLYITHALSRLAELNGDHMTALSYARQSLENMQETGDAALACLFYIRMGTVYSHLDKPEEALTWFSKSYSGKKERGMQLFWYKGFMSAAHLLAYMNRSEEALSLIQETTTAYPPDNAFEKMHLALIKGYSYEQLKNIPLAEENYNTFTFMAEQFPDGETPEAFYRVSRFYFNQGQPAKARIYLKKALAFTSGEIDDLAGINLLLSKLDSAAGRYASALQYHVQYAFYKDSIIHLSQRKQMNALTEKYETEKRVRDSKLLSLQLAERNQSGFMRNILVCGLASLLIIAGLFYHQQRLKREADQEIIDKNIHLHHLAHEKEWLLKEVHHRVKNNLQTIVSLLASTSASAVQNSQNRAYAMSLLHQKLYLRENMTSIDIRSYLPELVHYLRDHFNVSRRIHIHMQIPPLELDVAQAVPITLVINEAITNSIKHAFPGKELGQEITICMEQGEDNEITLTIADNGIGLPPEPDEENYSGSGLKFMHDLVEVMDGTFLMDAENGTLITIHFMANIPLYKTEATLSILVG